MPFKGRINERGSNKSFGVMHRKYLLWGGSEEEASALGHLQLVEACQPADSLAPRP
jgi:hypothetical protein